MSGPRVEIDRAGVAAWLKANTGAATRAKAEAMAALVRAGTTRDVTVEHYVTDRPHSTVMSHFGASVEAKRGDLARAATALGLTVDQAGRSRR